MISDLDTLKSFLAYPLENSDAVFARFAGIPGAIARGKRPERFVYLPGKRKDRVLLVAHADTVWDDGIADGPANTYIERDGEIVADPARGIGLGADDRAGCAVLWLLRGLGHSLLLTDGEEQGRRGSNWLMEDCAGMAAEINGGHGFAVEFDRGCDRQYKCYNIGTPEFRAYIERTLGHTEPDRHANTDIVTLCRDIPGVNLSLGFYEWHSPDERLVISEWQSSLDRYREWLERPELPKYRLTRAVGENRWADRAVDGR